MDDVIEILEIVDDAEYNQKRMYWKRKRLSPIVYIESDFLFKLTYRFTKENVEKIATELSPFLNLSTSNRGNPFTAVEVVCSGLEILGGVTSSGQRERVVVQGYHLHIKTCTGTDVNIKLLFL